MLIWRRAAPRLDISARHLTRLIGIGHGLLRVFQPTRAVKACEILRLEDAALTTMTLAGP